MGKALVDCIGRLEERRLRLYEQFVTSEDVPRVNTGDLDSVSLATIQKRIVDVDSQLTRSMQERTEPSITNREG